MRNPPKTHPAAPQTVCVIGGGPAGLVVASGLVRRGIPVVLLESGDAGHDPKRQQLSAAHQVGDELGAFAPIANRVRQLGGNSNAWVVKTTGTNELAQLGVRYGELSDQDLSARAWVDGKWPIDRTDLDGWYHSVYARFAIGSSPGEAADRVRCGPFGERFAHDFDGRRFRFGLRDRIRRDLVAELDSSPLGVIKTNATVTRLRRSTSSDRIRSVEVRSPDGSQTDVVADIFVLACGAIENARLLLASDESGCGIGNETDQVGRYFMDHPLYSVGHIELAEPDRLDDLGFFDLCSAEGTVTHGYAATSTSLCDELRALQIAISLFPRPNQRHIDAIEAAKRVTDWSSGTLTAGSTLRALARGADYLPRAAWNSIVRRRSLLPGYGRGGWAAGHDGMAFTRMEVVFQCEQAPLHESQVRLSDELDIYGSRLPEVDWRLGDGVVRSVLAVQRRLSSISGNLGKNK